jgi:hypothetical protein
MYGRSRFSHRRPGSGTSPAKKSAQKTPPSKLDVWRSAVFLVRTYGPAAQLVAAQLADEMLAKGDENGHALWGDIARIAEGLIRASPPDGEYVN